jgi:predicted 2-oxoglutarate/Fe(II)-dependent dioxygenase YbiX
MNLIDHGFGVIEFEEAIKINDKLVYNLIAHLQKENEKTFSYFTENGIQYARNKSGFVFSAEDIKSAPSRYTDLSFLNLEQEKQAQYKDFIKSVDSAIYNCLVEYCRRYPDAATTVWWRTDGHIASYGPGQYIGPHSDNQMPYPDSNGNFNSIPVHNTVSSALFLNSQSEVKDLDDYRFSGGEVYLQHADFLCKPKAGNVIMYPSNYIGRHEVKPVTSGNRHVYLQFFSHGKNDHINENSIKWLKDLQKDVISG